MPLMPVMLNGRIRLVALPDGAGARDMYEAEEENARRLAILKRREYLAGEQYDDENLRTMSDMGLDPATQRLPEHLRLHAYSVQLKDSLNFLTDQLAGEFAVKADDAGVQEVIDKCLALSDQLSGEDEDDEVSISDVLKDALTAGDVPVYLGWDAVEGSVYLEFWESEQIEFKYEDRTTIERVIREEMIWVPDLDGGEKQVTEKVVYDLGVNSTEDADRVWFEARRRVFWDDEDEPREVSWLGVPFIPWGLLRVDKAGLRATRGESVVTDQAMNHADRYNANEQVAWLIARYNSHGNLAVVGDAALLKLEKDERVAKDVADVLKFPGGTNLHQIELPTDPEMIEHQRSVLAEAMYQTFGLTRVEPETLESLGGISGYALEILNRKTEGTFKRIRKNFGRDLRGLLNQVLDMHQAMTELGEDEVPGWLSLAESEVETLGMFPDRSMSIRMGSGYIVDDVMIRDDFIARLISQQEALRQRGYTDTQIKKVMDEQAEAQPAVPEVGSFTSQTQAGGTVGSATR